MSDRPALSLGDVVVHDWRERQRSHRSRSEKKRYRTGPDGGAVERDPRAVDGVVLHQTACVFGPAGDLVRRTERALDIKAHATAFADGTGVLAYPLRWQVNHGHGFNGRSLGLEIEGRFPGVEALHRYGARLVECQKVIVTARRMLRELVELGRAEGMPIRYVWAHRQSSGARRSDPGELLWREVASWGERELGLELQPALTLTSKKSGQGRPIPLVWDVDGVGAY